VNTTLRVVDERGDWIQVEFQDPQYGRRVGYVEAAKVRVLRPEQAPMDLSVSSPATAAPPSSGGYSTPSQNPTSLLALGKRVYVVPVPGKDFNEDMAAELRAWGRWNVVESQSDADIIVRMDLGGSGGWGRGSMVVTIQPADGGPTLWKSKKQSGTRTVFHGYASPYRRALEGIMIQMKDASANWPRTP
jgi:hypothetical protein